MDDPPELPIGEVARRAGVATSAIRYYERIGLLPHPDRLHRQRRYHPDVVGQLAFIGVAQSAGFKLDEIKNLMRGASTNGMGEHMRALSTQKLSEVDEMLARARAMKTWLEVANTCECASPDECTLFPEAGDTRDPTAALSVVQVNGRDCRRGA